MEANLDMSTGSMSPAEAADALRALPGALETELTQAAHDIGLRIGRDAAEDAPRDMGQLQADLIVPMVERIGSLVVRVRVGSNLPQMAHEFGTDPGHFPPPDALRGWARRVLGDEDLAYPVARSIADTGLDEQRFLRDAIDDNLDWVADRVTQAVDAALREVGLR